jgi:hypothetical protein
MKKSLIMAIVVAVVFGGAGFFGGMKYGKSKSSSPFGNFPQGGEVQSRFGQIRNGVQGNRQSGGFISGEIISKDDQSVTVKMQDGSSKIVFYSSTTSVGKMASGTSTDLVVGENISITGTTNTDGSVTAQSIQVRPVMPLPSATPKQ